MLRLALFTLLQALLSTALAAAVGLCAAFFTARRSFFLRRFLLSLSSIPLCLPPLIMALGYVTFFGMSGIANQWLKVLLHTKTSLLTFLYSMKGIVIAQGFYNFPLVMATVGASWSHLSPEQGEAARLLGASEGRIFRTITLHQLQLSIGSACIPIFLFCFFSFMIVLLFGGVGCATLEVEIYRSVNSSLDWHRAFSLAALETGIALCMVALYCALIEKHAKAAKSARSLRAAPAPRLPLAGSKERLAFALFLLAAALFFLAPLAGILWNALSTQQGSLGFASFARVFSMRSFAAALRGTCLTALATGCLCAATAFFYAVFLRSHSRVERLLAFRVLPMLPMALSSVVTGSLLMLLVRRGNVLLLVLAQTALFWPFAFRQVYAYMGKIPQETLDAARLLAKRPLGLDTLTGVYLPCTARAVISSAGFCFAMSAGDTTLPLVMAIPGFNSLALFTYRLASSYRFHEACASGLVLALLCTTVFSAAQTLRKD